MYRDILEFIKNIYPKETPVPLHAPRFMGNEKKYLCECIDSTFVSYVGKFVTQFEDMVKSYTGSKYAVAMGNGTLALHTALIVSGVKSDDEVLTQALTFVATTNAISYTGAKCVFIDSDKETMGMSHVKLQEFLQLNTIMKNDGFCYNKKTNKRISACIPMHVFGHPVKIDEIKSLCDAHNIVLIEDSAESLGSFYKGVHTGLFGKVGVLSFNGNKTITTGGGGMLITDDEKLATRAKHISTTAKVKHAWEFVHDEVGYNYRMPNVNAAIGCAQMENLETYLQNKRDLADMYREFFESKHMSTGSDCVEFVSEPKDCKSNYWLNAVIMKDRAERDKFLELSNSNGVMTRPVWRLMNKLEMNKNCQTTNLDTAQWLEDRIVNIPSSVRI